jgi:hypothetical protein
MAFHPRNAGFGHAWLPRRACPFGFVRNFVQKGPDRRGQEGYVEFDCRWRSISILSELTVLYFITAVFRSPAFFLCWPIMIGAMRALFVAMLPLVALANRMPEVAKSALQKRADTRPYIIEQACRTLDQRYV